MNTFWHSVENILIKSEKKKFDAKIKWKVKYDEIDEKLRNERKWTIKIFSSEQIPIF